MIVREPTVEEHVDALKHEFSVLALHSKHALVAKKVGSLVNIADEAADPPLS